MTAQTQDSLIPCATATPTTAVAVLAVAAVMATAGLQIIQVGIGATPPDGITMDAMISNHQAGTPTTHGPTMLAMSKANVTTMLLGIVVEDLRAINSTGAAAPDA